MGVLSVASLQLLVAIGFTILLATFWFLVFNMLIVL